MDIKKILILTIPFFFCFWAEAQLKAYFSVNCGNNQVSEGQFGIHFSSKPNS